MKKLDKREQIQKEALEAWIKADCIGTLEIITGLGKTKIALDAIALEPKKAKILFLAETTQREKDLKADMKKFKCKHEVEFACYQSAYKWKDLEYDLVIADKFCSL